ncbi:FKBP-type peptidyl-prolyl cis-trans isomerase N-terminal domain-containing protein [Mucilaginibacter sp. Mucisp86]|uniref:FKBP-type peptidyl-prolyl cis-trans isomerase N-terminal domain-containing protein n=1 Tax=Mucilaginibacter sp. Mucisp86 TaxID=3243060 RepID=UPI0039B4BAFB
MKRFSVLFIVLLSTTFCFGQLPYSEKGVTISYDGNEKIGTRYEEKCKATLDVYRVTGTIKNSNSDKAVRLRGAALTFNGNDCGWYEGHYGIESEIYHISFSNIQNWHGQWVDILPNKQLTLSAEVLVTQDRRCPEPGYNFQFDLVTLQEKPSQAQQQAPVKNSLQWSGWKSFNIDNCNPNIEYRYLVERGYGLNYQVHMWFEVKNNNDKEVSYLFNLLDDKEKVQFGDQHVTKPGEITRFVHKMSGDIVKKWKLVNLVYTDTGKPVCEKQQSTNSSPSQGNKQNAPAAGSQTANQGSQNSSNSGSARAGIKGNSGEFTYKGIKYAGKCTYKTRDQDCNGGSMSVSMESDERTVWIYNMPQGSSGTYNIGNGLGGNCELHFILPFFDAGKYKPEGSSSGTLTKTSSNSFTFICKLSNGETITGSGNYGSSEVKSAPVKPEQQPVVTVPPPAPVVLTPKEEAEKFLAENSKKPGIITTQSGLQYEIISQGTGSKPLSSDKVKFSSRWTTIIGKEIKDVTDWRPPAERIVSEVVPGMAEGFKLMSVGSKYRVFIPAKLGYGESKTPGFTYIWEVELLDIVK